MRSARSLLDDLLGQRKDERDVRVEFLVIIGLIGLFVALAFILLGDAISDLISLIGSGADRAG